jgi:hypothetical protein
MTLKANGPGQPIKDMRLIVCIYELESGEYWGEVMATPDGKGVLARLTLGVIASKQVTELTKDSIPELLDGLAEILSPGSPN